MYAKHYPYEHFKKTMLAYLKIDEVTTYTSLSMRILSTTVKHNTAKCKINPISRIYISIFLYNLT